MNNLPVLVYHHVNDIGEDVTPDEFEKQMAYISKKGYDTIFLKDWIHQKPDRSARQLAITFDDGYLDNYVYAYPILKKYNLKATIFVVTGRALYEKTQRPNLEQVWSGEIGRQDLPEIRTDWDTAHRCVLKKEGSHDYVTWSEMGKMEQSGCIDIQSHSHTHADYWISSSIVGFNDNSYFGVGWATDGDDRVGIPLYPRKSAMMARRYFDDVRLRDFVVQQNNRLVDGKPGAIARFSELMAEIHKYSQTQPLEGRYETEREQVRRIHGELALSKALIEKRLDKKCELICWPWGEYSDLSLTLAKIAGYHGAVAFKPGINSRGRGKAIWEIKRFSPTRNYDEFRKRLRYNSKVSTCCYFLIKTRVLNDYRKLKKNIMNKQLFRTIARKSKLGRG